MSAAVTSCSPSPTASPQTSSSSFYSRSPRSSFLPSQRSPVAPRTSPRHFPANSPRRPFNAPSSASSKQTLAEGGPVTAGSFLGYFSRGTQYSPDGYPPTAGHKVASDAGKPLGSTTGTLSAARKRKEAITADSSDESMSASSASSGAPNPHTTHRHHPPDEPSVRQDPARASAATVDSSFSREDQPQEARSTHGHSAAPKRSRQDVGTVKMMPPKYENCSPKDLGVLIANMLMELIRINDKIPLRDGRLTRFHSRAPPGISVSDYLQRLIQHATLSPPIMLSMVYYIDRLCNLYPAFTINSLTVHRFLITAATVAAKGLSDSFWTNPTYARIGGIPVSELATLELDMLQRVDWKIVPKPEVLEEYYSSLVERAEGYTIETVSSSSSSSMSMDESNAANKSSDEKIGGDEKMADDPT